MKKIVLLFLVCAVVSFNNQISAQAKKFTLFEHFTQASCGPCAVYNPDFQALFYKHVTNVHHLAYHTSWPGVDPMNAKNPTEVKAMVDNYGITGVPAVSVNGGADIHPADVVESMFTDPTTSPIEVKVRDVKNGTEVTTTVTITVVGSVPAGDYNLRAMAAEALVTYTSPPGSNGEKEFPNVFRKFVNSGGADGDVILALVQGQTYTFTYTYQMDPIWKPDQVFTMAYVYESNSKEVLNSAAGYDSSTKANITSKKLQAAIPGGNKIQGVINNPTNANIDIQIRLTSTHPADWSADYTFQGGTYSTEQTFTVTPGDNNVTLNVRAGTTPAIGDYYIEIFEVGKTLAKNELRAYVVSKIYDLVSYNTGVSTDLKKNCISGLAFAGNRNNASLPNSFLAEALRDGTLDGVKNLYYNTGFTGTNEVITDDLVEGFKAFMNRGGNLFITGQDIGRDIMGVGASNHPSTTKSDFYTNFLKTKFIDDGTSTRNRVIAKTGDAIFGLSGATAITTPYGAPNSKPDALEPIGANATSCFTYNNLAQFAGIRSSNGKYKTVYLGVGIEQLSNATIANVIVKNAHDWFYGTVSTEEFDAAMQAIQMGQSQPNPANDFTIIPFDGTWNEDLTLRVVDMTGKIVLTEQVASGISTLKLNTSELPAGIYFYQLTDGAYMGATHKLMIAH